MMLKKIALTMMVFHLSTLSYALDYAQAYKKALQHDPQWLSAQQEAEANFLDRNISRANLLPNVSFNYRWSENDSDGEVSRQGLTAKQNRQYHSYFSALVLRQPLFNLAAIRQYNQAGLTRKAAEWQLKRAEQQLAGRVFEAYLAVLMRQDEIRLKEVYLNVLKVEFQRSQKMFQFGEATRTDQFEIQSRQRFAEVELITLKNQYDADIRTLQAMLGIQINENSIQGLAKAQYDQFKLNVFADRAELGQWQELMQSHNADLAAAQVMYDVAKLQVKRLQAEYYPIINAFAQKQISTSNTENTVGEKYNTDSFGVEVSFPIFSGGSTSVAVKQARAREEQARFDLQTTQQQIENQLRQQYLNLMSSQQRISAYEQAVKSAEAQITATNYSMQGGERTNLDLLNAQQQYHQVLKDLSKANYDLLQAWLAIRLQAGVLNDEDIAFISNCFK